MKIPSTKPYFPPRDITEILKNTKTALKSGRLFNGPFLEKFENEFKKHAGTRYAVGMNAATSVLEAVMRFYGVKGKEVIVPVNTFIASGNAVIFAGGMPVFVDINPKTLCLEPKDVERKITKKTKGIMLVHIGGLITPHVEEIKRIAKKHKLFLLEDAAHAHGASYKGRRAGSWGDAAAFSFFVTKVMTSGGLGGMLTTNDKKLADIARSVRFHGEDKARGTQDRLGNDWSLSEVQAVVGLQQTKRLKDIVRKRMAIAKRYDKAFRGIENISLFTLPPNTVHSYYKYLILCKSLAYKQRLKERLKKKGIATGSLYWPPLHLQPAYKKLFKHKKGDFKVADDILPRVLALPMYTGMTKKEQDYVIKEFKICG